MTQGIMMLPDTLTDAEVMAYQQGHTTICRLALDRGVVDKVVRRWLVQRGVAIRGRRGRCGKPQQWAFIIEQIQAGRNMAEIAVVLGITRQRVHQIYRRHSGDTTPRLHCGGPPPVPDQLTEADVADLRSGATSTAELAQRHNVSVAKIHGWLNRRGVHAQRRSYCTRRAERVAEIQARLARGERQIDIARALGMSPQVLWHMIQTLKQPGTSSEPDQNPKEPS